MNIIKLDAIGSTNTYLKELLMVSNLSNLTVVTAQRQLEGRGQRGTKWVSQEGSSLSFSVLVKDSLSDVSQIFDLNILVALSVLQGIKKCCNLSLAIKWPNDILADNKKIAGILIENSIKSSTEIVSIVGIGINVNQQNFDDLPQASSLKLLCGNPFDKEIVLQSVLECLSENLEQLKSGNAADLWKLYHDFLYQKDKLAYFELPDKTLIQGYIQGVSPNGLLIVELPQGNIEYFGLKEIKMIY
ncbi:biotin--[acetyl-CoA-carboxylase] ligase [Myroides sp. LJL116]